MQDGQSFSAKPVTSRDLAALLQILVSLLLHGLFFSVLFLLPDNPQPEPEKEQEIEVEIIPFAALPPPPAPAPSVESSKPQPSENSIQETEAVDPDGMIRPSQMLSGSVLAQENNALARQSLREIPPDERREQLCMLEAMEQLASWDPDRQPDLVLSYTFEDTRWQEKTLYADGAAMMSKGQWYYLSYECSLSANERTVTDFAFKLGDPVPKRLWDGYDLIEQVHDTAEKVERYNKKTRGN